MCSASLQIMQSWEERLLHQEWLLHQRSIQRDLNRLGTWAEGNFLKFSIWKCQVLPVGRNKSMHQDGLGQPVRKALVS